MLSKIPSRKKLFLLFGIILILSTAVMCYLCITTAGDSVPFLQRYHFVSESHLHDPTIFSTSSLSTLPFSTSSSLFGNYSFLGQNSTIPQIVKTGRLSIVSSNTDKVVSQRVGSKDEVFERSQDYCDIWKHSVFDSGDDIPSMYNLSSIAIVVRHGDRTPLYTLPNHKLLDKLSCKLTDDKFISLVESIQKEQNHLGNWWQNSYPRSAKCAAGQLTSRGFQQMVHLGEILRRTYADKKNLSSEVYIRVTQYARTLQSAVGFLYGFLSNADFKRVKVEFDKDIYFCSHSVGNFSCYCPATTKLQKTIDEEHRQIDDKDQSRIRQTKQIKEKVAAVLGAPTGQIPWLGAVLEVAMTHVCHGLSPPCRENSQKKTDCLTWSFVSKLRHFLDVPGQRRPTTTTASDKQARLFSYPLLYEIVQRFLAVARSNTHQKSRIHLFSGHDKTISALLTSLDIYDGRWPPYASSLVFELYDRRKKQFYVRFLYNGKDVTKKVRFCRDVGNDTAGLCPFDNFMYFVFYETSKYFGSSDYKEMCR